MSIFFDFDTGPSGRRFRRAVDRDKYDIELFWNRAHTDRLFGDIDIGSLIELSTLSICMIDENKEVVGFMALCDHPDVRGLDPADWEIWFRNMFQKFYVSRNTLFIHFMCCMDSVIDYFLEEALISVFQNDAYLLYIVLVVPASCDNVEFIVTYHQDCREFLTWFADTISRYQTFKKRNMYKYFPRRDEDGIKTCTDYMYTAQRQDYCPKLKMRRAVEEDNDDIVEILDRKCPQMKELYGNYYISEVIGRHPESKRKVIVADYQDRAIGVMCLNSDINYKKLQNLYELRPYYGLRKATALEKEQNKRSNALLRTFGEPIMMGKWSPFNHITKLDEINLDISKHNFTERRCKKSGKVNFGRDASRRRSTDHSTTIALNHSDDFNDNLYLHSPTVSQLSKSSVINLLLDEDPFDYDIVNIDSNLLTIPEVHSNDLLSKPTESSRLLGSSGYQNKRKKRNSVFKPNNIDSKESVIYHGDPNAFVIELFGFREDVNERSAFDLLEAAFEIMKDFDYCIISVPSANKTFPLLQHFCYVPTKPKLCSKHSLYVAHRCSVLGKLRVREAELVDIPQIAQFLQTVAGKDTIWTIENSILDNKQHKAYVFMSGLSLVGIGIIEPPEQLGFMRAKFNIDLYHNHKYHLKGQESGTGFSMVKAVLVYPVFEVHFRYFAREMMRLSGSNSLIWLTAYRNKWVAQKANSLASAMVPLLPRRSELDFGTIPELVKISAFSKKIMAFSAWFMSKKLTSVPITNVGSRIVLVGASRTAMAFLNSLLFSDSSPYLIFTNVTLISPNGLPYAKHSKTAAEMMFPRYHSSSNNYLKSVPYTYYVNIVQGTMVEINKQGKYISLTNGNKYHYDLLFLLFGKQYQHPNYLQPLLERERDIKTGSLPSYIRLDVPKRIDPELQVTTYDTPDNVFIINNITEANKALKYIKNLFQESEYKILVYGATIHAYCCLAALLEMKVPTENIIFIEPFPPEEPYKTRVSVFCNANVDQTVREVLDNLKIQVYRSYYFQSWTIFDNLVTQVDFISHFRMIHLECSAFFYYGTRGVNTEAFFAVNKCGMAYDGGVLIDHRFRTKDPAIYAAGPATAYYRRYFAQIHKQKYYDSYEVGEKLGIQIRNALDPLFSEKSDKPSRKSVRFSTKSISFDSTSTDTGSEGKVEGSTNSKSSSSSGDISDKPEDKLPDLKKPLVTYCSLPGGLQYLEVRSPGMKIPHHYVQSLQYSGIVMETFKGGYFKLHLTNDLIVDGITCLTPEKYSLEIFKNIYGLSAVVLNNFHLRYTTKKLEDFYEFFRSPWAFFLYHDQTDELFAMVKELLPKGQRKGDTLGEALRSIGETLHKQSSISNTKLQIRNKFEKSPHVEAIADYVIEWLSENDALLPMYLQPCQNNEYTYDLEKNPAFRKKRRTITKMISMIT